MSSSLTKAKSRLEKSAFFDVFFACHRRVFALKVRVSFKDAKIEV